jgi:hypothetical protein
MNVQKMNNKKKMINKITNYKKIYLQINKKFKKINNKIQETIVMMKMHMKLIMNSLINYI